MDYERMDPVNGTYAAENKPAWTEQEKWRMEEKKREEEKRLEAEKKAAVMRRDFPFFGWASAVYALFYTFCLYKNASGITYPFFVAGTLIYFGLCSRRSGVPLKKDSTFTVVSMLDRKSVV